MINLTPSDRLALILSLIHDDAPAQHLCDELLEYARGMISAGACIAAVTKNPGTGIYRDDKRTLEKLREHQSFYRFFVADTITRLDQHLFTAYPKTTPAGGISGLDVTDPAYKNLLTAWAAEVKGWE